MLRSLAAAVVLSALLSGLPLCVCAADVPHAAFDVDALRGTAEVIRNQALKDPTAYNVVESLTTEVGPRLAGTEAGARARDWGVATLKALGFANVHAEAFPITAWIRGEEAAAIIAPVPQKLAVLALGGSVPTLPAGINAEAVVFRTYADLLVQAPGSLTGKIAIVTQPMVRTMDGSGYGAASAIRRAGASEAARRGAVAYMHRSLATGASRAPHTGALNYAVDAPRIPAAALSVADAELLDHLSNRHQPIRIHLQLASHIDTNATAWNVVGDIPGSERPTEMLIIGGHLDSWDPGTGAIDDGAGIAITVAAARLAGAAPHPPRRTLRVVMFGAEEMDFANAAFTKAHAEEVANIVAISESDAGADRIWSVQLPGDAASKPFAKILGAVLAPLSVFVSPEAAIRGGSDIAGLARAGVPVVAFRQDASRYFDWHHSADDTLDKVDPVQLQQNVAAWAAFLYLAANSAIDFRASNAPTTAP